MAPRSTSLTGTPVPRSLYSRTRNDRHSTSKSPGSRARRGRQVGCPCQYRNPAAHDPSDQYRRVDVDPLVHGVQVHLHSNECGRPIKAG